ncbi:hypothetical protein TNCV_4752881 [Trichonephila clavipes]|nr:hypothetical protein TNCV_4752881 [Trichonephila clavipes]
MQWLHVYSRGLEVAPNATVMVANVTMKRERSFVCPQDVKTQMDPLEDSARRILRTNDGGKPNRLAASLSTAGPPSCFDAIAFSFRQQCRENALELMDTRSTHVRKPGLEHDQEDNEKRGSKDRAVSTCAHPTGPFNDTSGHRRCNVPQTICRLLAEANLKSAAAISVHSL